MAARRDDDWRPTVHVIGSREPTQELLDTLAHEFRRGHSAENVRIRFALKTVEDVRRITDDDIAGFEQLSDDEKGALRRLRMREEAKHRTHPSGTYGRGYELRRVPVDFAEAEALLGEFCGRMVEWGLANYSPISREWRVLDGLRGLEAALSADPDWAAIARSAEQIQEADGTVHQLGLSGFSLQFELRGVLYDMKGVVAFFKGAAEAAMDAGPRVGEKRHIREDAKMQTLLGRLQTYIG